MYRYTCSTCRRHHTSEHQETAQDHQAEHHRTAHRQDVPVREHVYFRREPQRPRIGCLLAPFAIGLVIAAANWIQRLLD
ncbi:hypothetical protein [Streptomyces sp. NPDC001889]